MSSQHAYLPWLKKLSHKLVAARDEMDRDALADHSLSGSCIFPFEENTDHNGEYDGNQPQADPRQYQAMERISLVVN